MATTTQYNPDPKLNETLFAAGTSKTVYALVTPETEAAKARVFGEGNVLAHDDAKQRRADYFDQFREAWTGKQDAYHRDFFAEWAQWASPVIDFDRDLYPFFYPTAGASEPLRQIIFDFAARGGKTINVLAGEYEGYKSQAEAAGLTVEEWDRSTVVRDVIDYVDELAEELFFISQPSAIDGNVWDEFNALVDLLPANTVIADVTYVGAVPQRAIKERFNLNAPAIRNVVFSLSKPFGLYYDRVGGVFSREKDLGLFGNIWFKSLTALSIGRQMMREYGVFDFPDRFANEQRVMTERASLALGIPFVPADVFILANAWGHRDVNELTRYLFRGEGLRLCLTPGMAKMIGIAA